MIKAASRSAQRLPSSSSSTPVSTEPVGLFGLTASTARTVSVQPLSSVSKSTAHRPWYYQPVRERANAIELRQMLEQWIARDRQHHRVLVWIAEQLE